MDSRNLLLVSVEIVYDGTVDARDSEGWFETWKLLRLVMGCYEKEGLHLWIDGITVSDINLTKDLSLLLYSVRSSREKTISSLFLKIHTEKSTEQQNLSLFMKYIL